MKKVLFTISLIVIVTGACLWFSRVPRKHMPDRQPAPEKHVRTFQSIGLQVEAPLVPEFESAHANRVLLMFHGVDNGFLAERSYLVQISVVRMSKEQLEEKARIAFESGADEFYKWYATNHPSLEIRRAGVFWYLRKDIQTPNGEYLYVDGQVQDYGSTETNLAQAKETIESFKPLQ